MVKDERIETVVGAPGHVAIIMDGNGRWAQARGLTRNEGHRAGVDNARKVVRAAGELGIRYLTLFAFSVENWKRPKTEVGALMDLLVRFLRSEARELEEREIRLHVIGQTAGLPQAVREELEAVCRRTAHFDRWHLNLALNYGARSEVLEAVKRYSQDVVAGRADPESLDWAGFSRYLYTGDIPDPDLIIRTSGENRLSNFLLLQGAYAEFYFSPVYWPEFGTDELKQAIASFRNRERRFGLTGEQIRAEGTELVAGP